MSLIVILTLMVTEKFAENTNISVFWNWYFVRDCGYYEYNQSMLVAIVYPR